MERYKIKPKPSWNHGTYYSLYKKYLGFIWIWIRNYETKEEAESILAELNSK